MSNILDFAIYYKNKEYEKTGKYPKEIYLTPEQYYELLSTYEHISLLNEKPKPPVKSKSTSSGLFTFSEQIEYDHSAPDYLRQLDEYYKNKKEKSDDLYFLGMKVIINEVARENKGEK